MSFEYYHKMSTLLRGERGSACDTHTEKIAATIKSGKNGCCMFYLFKNSLWMYILQTTDGKLSLYSISVEFPQSIKPLKVQHI